ncbi:MAG: VIT1/CCC1 family protein [Candidatus Micrarchaeales archaeon]|jgi:VIT1/CCC1 family predicted Fe2+/Mn2+ transporter
MKERAMIEREFLKDEIRDTGIYSSLSKRESDPEIRRLLKKLSEMEKKHARIWRTILEGQGERSDEPKFINLRTIAMLIIRRVFGIALVVKFLEGSERDGLAAYRKAIQKLSLGPKERNYTREIIKDEEGHQKAFAKQVDKYKGDLRYTQSIILGLNDGLVEILAVVAGIATVATTGFIVVIMGMIAGISGTLSMAGGVYLSSKSEKLVEKDTGMKDKQKILPMREAYYTGICYFAGALLAVLPFIFGLSGIGGVLLSIILVSAALIVASAVIAIISGTSIRRRSLEMLAISLGAAFITILFGIFAKTYFGFRV